MKRQGGVYAVADDCGVHFTQLFRFLRGGGLSTENAGKLRAAVSGVPDSVWADVFAPKPDSTPTAEAS